MNNNNADLPATRGEREDNMKESTKFVKTECERIYENADRYLKKLYTQKYDWENKQLENVEYLFERFLRLQQTVMTLQSEMQDLKSVFKLYFERGGAPIVSQEGDTLVYNSKQTFGYDFNEIKPVLEEIGALEKAVKLNTGFIDRLVNGRSLDEDKKEIIKNARQELTETRNIQVIKNK